MMDKFGVLFSRRIPGSTTLLTGTTSTKYYIKNILVKEVGDVGTIRFKINDEVISDDYEMKYGKILEFEAKRFVDAMETFSIEVDVPKEDEYGTKMANEVKQRFANTLPNAEIIFVKYGIICFKSKKKYIFFNASYDKILEGDKLEILLDAGRYTYFFKLDDVLYTIKDGGLTDISTFADLRIISGERFVFENRIKYTVQIYSSRTQSVERSFNGEILDYDENTDTLIIREDGFSNFDPDTVPNITDRRTNCKLNLYNLKTGAIDTLITWAEVLSFLNTYAAVYDSADYKYGSDDRRWAGINVYRDGNTLIYFYQDRGGYSESYYYKRFTFVWVYNLTTKKVVKSYIGIPFTQLQFTKGHLLLTRGYDWDSAAPYEYIYNYRTDKEYVRPLNANWKVAVTVFNDKIYLTSYERRICVLPDIEAYINITPDQINWSKEQYYINTYTKCLMLHNDGSLIYRTTYANTEAVRYVANPLENISKDVSQDNGIEKLFPISENTAKKISYSGPVAKLGNYMMEFGYNSTHVAFSYFRNCGIYSRDTEDTIVLNAFLDNPLGTTMVMPDYNKIVREVYTKAPGRASPFQYKTDTYYTKRDLTCGIKQFALVGGTDGDNVVALLFGVDYMQQPPLLVKITAKDNNVSSVDMVSIFDIMQVVAFIGNDEDGYTLFTDRGKVVFKPFKTLDISVEARKEHFLFNGEIIDKPDMNLTKVNEGAIGSEAVKQDQLYIRLEGVTQIDDNSDEATVVVPPRVGESPA